MQRGSRTRSVKLFEHSFDWLEEEGRESPRDAVLNRSCFADHSNSGGVSEDSKGKGKVIPVLN
jgi:hypothetical protein